MQKQRKPLPFATRQIRQNDIPFVRSSWLRSYHKFLIGKTGPRGVSPPVYNLEHPQLIMRLLERSVTCMACNPEDDDHIFGYICWEMLDRPTIHYLLLKHEYQHCSMARGLLKTMIAVTGNVPMWASHWTPLLNKLVPAELRIEFNPYKLWESRTNGK